MCIFSQYNSGYWLTNVSLSILPSASSHKQDKQIFRKLDILSWGIGILEGGEIFTHFCLDRSDTLGHSNCVHITIFKAAFMFLLVFVLSQQPPITQSCGSVDKIFGSPHLPTQKSSTFLRFILHAVYYSDSCMEFKNSMAIK